MGIADREIWIQVDGSLSLGDGFIMLLGPCAQVLEHVS
jgi:hypothetical protein